MAFMGGSWVHAVALCCAVLCCAAPVLGTRGSIADLEMQSPRRQKSHELVLDHASQYVVVKLEVKVRVLNLTLVKKLTNKPRPHNGLSFLP
jgi:hypothetical protein